MYGCMNKTYICVCMYVYSIAVFKSWVLTPSIIIYFFLTCNVIFSPPSICLPISPFKRAKK